MTGCLVLLAFFGDLERILTRNLLFGSKTALITLIDPFLSAKACVRCFLRRWAEITWGDWVGKNIQGRRGLCVWATVRADARCAVFGVLRQPELPVPSPASPGCRVLGQSSRGNRLR